MRPSLIKALGVGYMLLVGAVFAGASVLWPLRCEGFGCTGLGIAWMAWALVLYLPVGLVGLWALSKVAQANGLWAAVRLAGWAQLALGLGLLIYMIVWRAK